MISAGELRNKIVIEERAPELETFGGPPIFKPFGVLWAAANPNPVLGREVNLGEVVNDLRVSQFITRYLPGITAAMRINWAGRIYNITSVVNEGELNEKLILTAEEGQNEG